MAKLSLYLFGKHSKRTPFAYQDYRPIFEQKFHYSDDPLSADIILTGFIKDFKDNKEFVGRIKTKNPECKLVVISEEPLWDTIWTSDFNNETIDLICCGKSHTVYQFNHYNSTIFEFSTYPYYITTSNRFFSRYCSLFQNISKYSEEDVLKIWISAPYRSAFLAEKRLGENYAKQYPELKTWGLSKYRTDLALSFVGQNPLIEGKDWQANRVRQDLPDWHLDKLAKLNKSSTFISAIENTYYKTYITEKIFDAYACLGIPLYVGGIEHGIKNIIKYQSWIDIYGLSPQEAFDRVNSFIPTSAFTQEYIQELNNLARHFSNSYDYVLERQNFANRFTQLLYSLSSSACDSCH